jgi:pyruvate-ferredoxin/flavodoxin oxidoreductase
MLSVTRHSASLLTQSLRPAAAMIRLVRPIASLTAAASKGFHCRKLFSGNSVLNSNQKRVAITGNHAAALAAYSMSDILIGFPITPSSNAFELTDIWSTKQQKNAFGEVPSVYTMQSEGGVAGALHGAVSTGALASTFTSSQGLLLMIPNLYKMGPARMPAVIHVAARSLIRQISSIFCDHSDVMACRQTGWGMLFASSVQEAYDFGLISHIAAIRGGVPMLHVYDGFRTSHEIASVNVFKTPEDLRNLIPAKDIQEFKRRSFNPDHPHIRGVPADSDVYMQWQESMKPTFDNFPSVMQSVMEEYSAATGRLPNYHLFEYHGHPEPEHVLVIMGSAAHTAQETVKHLVPEKLGVVSVKLYRPWSESDFLASLPLSAKKVTVLDRTREFGASGEPLYLDVVSTLAKSGRLSEIKVLNGVYGIAGKELTPSMLMDVFSNSSKDRFTVGIEDDVTHNSVSGMTRDFSRNLDVVPDSAYQSIFLGLGADGTVGATQEAISIVTDQTDLNSQGYFTFEAKKTGGWTFSHVRFDEPKSELKARYEVLNADYIGCNHSNFLQKFPIADRIKPHGKLVINCEARTVEELEHLIPPKSRAMLAERNVKIYGIDAIKLSEKIGLGKHINMIMQAIFFKISKVMPDLQKCKTMLVESVKHKYAKQGSSVVQKNIEALELAFGDDIETIEGGLVEFVYDKNSWISASNEFINHQDEEVPEIVQKLFLPAMNMRGNEIPMSSFTEVADGRVIPGTSKFEKRDLAIKFPVWKPSKCSTCNVCSLVCSQSAIRPFLLSKQELKDASQENLRASIPSRTFKDYEYSVAISPFDCLGCGVCVSQCPEKALELIPRDENEDEVVAAAKEFKYLEHLHNHGDLAKVKTSVRGSQFQKPLLEFPGACEGCGEAMYAKLLTQLFGERMFIANATGCSIVWGSYFPSMAYTTNEQGQGPAWGNSLFEDNAEYGYGMARAMQHRRNNFVKWVSQNLEKIEDIALEVMVKQWIENMENAKMSSLLAHAIKSWLVENKEVSGEVVEKIRENTDLLVKPSHWIIGGDGWAYDIGFGGLDHVLAQSDVDVNMFVFDNELYANTGFQMSKASPRSSVNKFSSGGKMTGKKDLGMMMIQAAQNNHAYVASISLGANYGLALQAIKEAEAFPGPSLIIAYSPCIGHGMRDSTSNTVQEEKLAVECGYWPLYRYNPLLIKEGKNPFIMDATSRKRPLKEFLDRETRFMALRETNPEIADQLQNELQEDIDRRWRHMERMVSSSDA